MKDATTTFDVLESAHYRTGGSEQFVRVGQFCADKRLHFYLCLTAHYINPDVEIVSKMLSCIVLHNRHTNDHVTEVIKKDSKLLVSAWQGQKPLHVTALRIFGHHSRALCLSEFPNRLMIANSVKSKPALMVNINTIVSTISDSQEEVASMKSSTDDGEWNENRSGSQQTADADILTGHWTVDVTDTNYQKRSRPMSSIRPINQ
jgi:hypothetical protein